MKELQKRGEVKQKIQDALHQDMLLARLSAGDSELLLSSARAFAYEANEYLCSAGESPEHCYLLLSGDVSLVVPFSEAGGFVEMDPLSAPRILGITDFLLQQERSAHVLTKSEVWALRIPCKSFQELLRRMPLLVFRLCQSMAEMVSMLMRKPTLPTLKLKVLDRFQPDAMHMMPSHLLLQHKMLPLELEGNLLRIAFVKEPTQKVLDTLQEVLPGVQPYLFRISERNFQLILKQQGLSDYSSDGLPKISSMSSGPLEPPSAVGFTTLLQAPSSAPAPAPFSAPAQAPSSAPAQAPSSGMDNKTAQDLLQVLTQQNQAIQQLHVQTQQSLQLQAQQNQAVQVQAKQAQAMHAQLQQTLQHHLNKGASTFSSALPPELLAGPVGGGGETTFQPFRKRRKHLSANEKRKHLAVILPLLQEMVQVGASDLHLSARQSIRWRIDGELREVPGAKVLGEEEVYGLLGGMMEERHAKEFETKEQADFAYTIEGVARYRVNIFVEANGISAVLRQIPMVIPSASELRLPKCVCELTALKQGLVLVTGPTGSGKSTTLAALIDMINQARSQHIITLEDPIEFVHPSKVALINQREIGLHAESFTSALRAALREDPDIVLVGELRDQETMALAIETAHTGHLVLGTLHTNNVVSTIDRIIDMFPTEQQSQIRGSLGEVLKGVVSQVLCKQKAGRGRVAAFEVMSITSAVANMIRQGKTHQIPTAMSGKDNLLLNAHLEELVRKKLIGEEEALLRSHDKADMENRIRGLGLNPNRAGIQTSSARRG